MITPDLLSWLQSYYASCCNGDWEHGEGIRIETLDNPGWFVKMSLRDTNLAAIDFERVEVENSDQDWYHCWKEDEIFTGAGGLYNLTSILTIFREWVTANEVRCLEASLLPDLC